MHITHFLKLLLRAIFNIYFQTSFRSPFWLFLNNPVRISIIFSSDYRSLCEAPMIVPNDRVAIGTLKFQALCKALCECAKWSNNKRCYRLFGFSTFNKAFITVPSNAITDPIVTMDVQAPIKTIHDSFKTSSSFFFKSSQLFQKSYYRHLSFLVSSWMFQTIELEELLLSLEITGSLHDLRDFSKRSNNHRCKRHVVFPSFFGRHFVTVSNIPIMKCVIICKVFRDCSKRSGNRKSNRQYGFSISS